MKAEFWLSKWEKNEIGFHLAAPHPWLVQGWSQFEPAKEACVFVPLCGKTHDIDFFLTQGHRVVANELSEAAVKEVFSRLNITPSIVEWAGGSCYESEQLTVYVGDFFQLSAEQIGQVDYVYDRAAIIALPFEMREAYAQKIMTLCPNAQQCLITLAYDQNAMTGPPFSVNDDEVKQHYSKYYKIERLHGADILEHEPKFKQNGLNALEQSFYRLTPNF